MAHSRLAISLTRIPVSPNTAWMVARTDHHRDGGSLNQSQTWDDAPPVAGAVQPSVTSAGVFSRSFMAGRSRDLRHVAQELLAADLELDDLSVLQVAESKSAGPGDEDVEHGPAEAEAARLTWKPADHFRSPTDLFE